MNSHRPRILLVGNYRPDRQHSMLRFGELLARALPQAGWEVEVIRPEPWAGRLRRGGALGKWLAYVDKYLLFPWRLARRVRAGGGRGGLLVHVADHSNAVYVPRRPTVPWVVTCHDLLAVRGALGEATDCPASALGRLLQRQIVGGLARASAVASISTSTLKDLERLVHPRHAQLRPLIILSQNHPYRPVPPQEAWGRLRGLCGLPEGTPFLLHVGSDLARKNRAGVVRVFARIASQWPGNLLFCGAELGADLRGQIAGAGLGGRVFAASGLSSGQLEAAYSLAHALVFPSTCEGFGWPVIEAQACGCPVICSDRTSLPEVGGDAALVHPLEDESGMAGSALRLCEAGFRGEVVQRGLANLSRFTEARLVAEYGALYEAAAQCGPASSAS